MIRSNRMHALTLAALFALLGGAANVMGQNLITNPGFESQGTGWTLFLQSGTVAQASVTYPNSGAHSGTRYARVEVTAAAASSAENWHVQFQPPTGWSAVLGTTYQFKFWGKSDAASLIHVSVQGSDYTYITGQSFGLSTDWTEYTMDYTADAEGTNAVRFHVYVGESADVYSFDDFSVTATAVGIHGGVAAKARGLRVEQRSENLVVSLGEGASGNLKVELMDLHGKTLAVATGKAGDADGALTLARPAQSGIYLVRARSAAGSWARTVLVP